MKMPLSRGISMLLKVRYEREADVPGQNTKKLNTGLLMRL